LIVRTNVHTFDWDDGNRAKCQKHGLSIAQIEFALTHGARVAPDARHSGEEQRFIAISRTEEGRPVFVAFCWREGRLRPISARYMHAREVVRYEEAFGARDDDG
jgi:uncharacterized DUF497 family protein